MEKNYFIVNWTNFATNIISQIIILTNQRSLFQRKKINVHILFSRPCVLVMASRRRCKSRVTADAAAAILNNWDSSCSELSDSDLDSDFDVGKWDCNSSSDWELTITSTREVVATTNAATGRSLGRTAGGSTSRVTTRPKRSDGAGSKQKNAKRIKKNIC